MIKLYQFRPAFGLPNPSPFCMKVETYLRMTGLPFETVNRVDLRKAPKGKAPYIEDGGRAIGDSGFIVDYLKATYGDPLDGWLSPEQCAIAHAFRRMMEENLYWVLLYSRWFEPEGWAKVSEIFFGGLPAPARWFVPLLARRGIRQELWGHGLGRHSREEIYQLGQRDIDVLADFLGGKVYFMGEQPCSIDAVAYAFLANVLWVPLDSPLKQQVLRHPHFEAYCRRMKARYYR
ncbi:MAG: glutathione S-transferase family protein [Chromatiales bacterium]